MSPSMSNFWPASPTNFFKAAMSGSAEAVFNGGEAGADATYHDGYTCATNGAPLWSWRQTELPFTRTLLKVVGKRCSRGRSITDATSSWLSRRHR